MDKDRRDREGEEEGSVACRLPLSFLVAVAVKDGWMEPLPAACLSTRPVAVATY